MVYSGEMVMATVVGPLSGWDSIEFGPGPRFGRQAGILTGLVDIEAGFGFVRP